jgi:hypothetical protein
MNFQLLAAAPAQVLHKAQPVTSSKTTGAKEEEEEQQQDASPGTGRVACK